MKNHTSIVLTLTITTISSTGIAATALGQKMARLPDTVPASTAATAVNAKPVTTANKNVVVRQVWSVSGTPSLPGFEPAGKPSTPPSAKAPRPRTAT